jgi:hypothetical protein
MKKIIDIISVILPALIIIMGITRLFVKKTNGFNGLTMFFAVLLLLAGLIRLLFFAGSGGSSNNEPPPQPVNVGKHSMSFNLAMQKVLASYFFLEDAIMKNDSSATRLQAMQLKSALDSFSLDDLKKDSVIYLTAQQPYENCRAEVNSMIADPSPEEKKSSFNIFSQELFQLLNTVKYDQEKIYWLECENAFGEKPGDWLSRSEKGTNPYGQPDCMELKSTIDHTADTVATHVKDTLMK